VLQENKLYYFIEKPVQDNTKPRGIINMSGATISEYFLKSEGYCMQLINHVKNKEYYICAENARELNVWLMTLSEAAKKTG